jgi:ribosome-associated protein
MLPVSHALSIPLDELSFDFIRASGPGGQNVNKVSTAVQLRFDVLNSPSLPEDLKERLCRLAGARLTQDGILLIIAKRYRSQDRNRSDALLRFTDLVRRAQEKPRKRNPTHPSKASQQRRLENKKHRGKIKRTRRSVRGEES